MLIEPFHNVWFWISETSPLQKPPTETQRVICKSEKKTTWTDSRDKVGVGRQDTLWLWDRNIVNTNTAYVSTLNEKGLKTE